MALPPFEILEHTADIGLRAHGATPAALFEDAAAGLLSIALETATVAEREVRDLEAEGADQPPPKLTCPQAEPKISTTGRFLS